MGYYSADPVQDAADHFDAIDARDAELDRAEQAAADEIRECFALIGTIPLTRICVPCVSYRVTPQRVEYVVMREVFSQVLGGGYVDEQRDAVIEKSECPFVAELRKAVCEQWIDSHAADIAQARLP